MDESVNFNSLIDNLHPISAYPVFTFHLQSSISKLFILSVQGKRRRGQAGRSSFKSIDGDAEADGAGCHAKANRAGCHAKANGATDDAKANRATDDTKANGATDDTKANRSACDAREEHFKTL